MHSQYDYDEKITFYTMAIGDEYIEKSLLLIQSVIKFTKSKIYVFTNNYNAYFNHIKYFGERLIVLDISNNDYYSEKIDGIFNYHLKGIILNEVSKLSPHPLIYIDADTFLFGWDNSISRYINSFENILIGRFRENVSINTNLSNFINEKCEKYNINKEDIDSPLIVENIMVLTRGNLTNKFIEYWKDISLAGIEKKVNPFIEAFEIAVSIKESKIKTFNVINTSPLVDSFRTLHTNNKIISTFVA